MLHIYNSLTQSKEPFKPLIPGKVKMYVCGMTVYDYCHLGHARTMVSFDVITRYLKQIGYDVNFVRNITDIDDKIIHRANELKIPIDALTHRFIEAMHEDEKALNILPPSYEPKATEHIPTIIALITRLLDKNVAYQAENGDIYYRVDSFPSYGKLAHKDIEGQKAGARVEITIQKDNPLDFVLWKQAKAYEPFWPSPWGNGRPGWHIECSAMSMHCLGEQFDIHGGGVDLKFPHHENEIAQSEAATNKKFVNTWMHVGFLNINQEKMSKSLGNFFTIREVLKSWAPEVVRYFLISSHYRSPLNYSLENLELAKAALTRLYISLRHLPKSTKSIESEMGSQFKQAMDDDFNTPLALSVLFDLSHQINQLRETNLERAAELGELLKQLGAQLGLLESDPETFLQGEREPQQLEEINKLIQERESARRDKNWSEADRLRQQLNELGVELEDSSTGTLWRLKN